jgi:branched-chain amino acid transport system substrate-binding protein
MADIVGDECCGSKDFAPYRKITSGGADAVSSPRSSFSSDLTLLVKARPVSQASSPRLTATLRARRRDQPGLASATCDRATVAKRRTYRRASEAFYRSFRGRFPDPADDYVHLRKLLVGRWHPHHQQGWFEAAVRRPTLERGQPAWGGPAPCARPTTRVPAAAGGRDDGPAGHARAWFDTSKARGHGFRVIRVLTAARGRLPGSWMIRP